MRTIAIIALATALGLTWAGAAIPADVKEQTKEKAETTKDKLKDAGEATKDKLKEAGEKTKEKIVETKDKVKEKISGNKDKSAKGDKGAKGAAGSDQVRSAQQALKDKGIDPGPIDGVMGPKTRAAVTDFQKKEGLKATGRLDADTSAKLGVTQTSGVQQPAPGASTGTSGSPAPAASPATTPPSENPPKQKP
jgi:peptidoglycan hydrolase-like protein with peptidoglycan-binding domain